MLEKNVIADVVHGLALGDAIGYPQEFKDYNPSCTLVIPETLIVSDDTQMSLYVMYGILDCYPDIKTTTETDQTKIRLAIAQRLQEFYSDPDNNRAPGHATMTSLKRMINHPEALSTGKEFSHSDAKGNGANIRVPWISLLPLPNQVKEDIAYLQASITHGHGMAAYASQLTVRCMNLLLSGEINNIGMKLPLTDSLLTTLPDDTCPYAEEFKNQILQMKNACGPFLAYEDKDMASFFGSGNTADNALINVLAFIDTYAWGSREHVGFRRLIHSSGDSDSMGAIAGAFLGAMPDYSHVENLMVGSSFEDRYEDELQDIITDLQHLQKE